MGDESRVTTVSPSPITRHPSLTTSSLPYARFTQLRDRARRDTDHVVAVGAHVHEYVPHAQTGARELHRADLEARLDDLLTARARIRGHVAFPDHHRHRSLLRRIRSRGGSGGGPPALSCPTVGSRARLQRIARRNRRGTIAPA